MTRLRAVLADLGADLLNAIAYVLVSLLDPELIESIGDCPEPTTTWSA